MRSRGLVRRGLPGFIALGVAAMVGPLHRSVEATPPVVTLSAAGAKIKVTSASLSDAIDALARAAGFKVTYEGGRPNAMLYNAEIDTPSVAQTLFRLIDGQNLNYAVMFDRTGRNVTTLMVLGAQPRTGAAPGAPAGAARPQPFTPPRGTRNDTPVVEDDPEPEPESTPTPVPSPPAPPRAGPGGQGSPFPPSPFAPRPPFGSPFGPRPSPSPSP